MENPILKEGDTLGMNGDYTLRDKFAGQAMVGILSDANFPPAEMVARAAYEVADAMLKERLK